MDEKGVSRRRRKKTNEKRKGNNKNNVRNEQTKTRGEQKEGRSTLLHVEFPGVPLTQLLFYHFGNNIK